MAAASDESPAIPEPTVELAPEPLAEPEPEVMAVEPEPESEPAPQPPAPRELEPALTATPKREGPAKQGWWSRLRGAG